MQIPMSLAYRDYVNKLCMITEKSGLPAFVTAGVLESLLTSERRRAAEEVKRDEALWRKMTKEAAENGDQRLSSENGDGR